MNFSDLFLRLLEKINNTLNVKEKGANRVVKVLSLSIADNKDKDSLQANAKVVKDNLTGLNDVDNVVGAGPNQGYYRRMDNQEVGKGNDRTKNF